MVNKKRLIDANFLDDRCRRQIADEWNKRVAPVSWSEAYNEFLDDVWDAPTVDAVPVVHGRWIVKEEPIPWCEDDVDMFWECSVCECRNFDESPYCPNCGADMRDGDGNGT